MCRVNRINLAWLAFSSAVLGLRLLGTVATSAGAATEVVSESPMVDDPSSDVGAAGTAGGTAGCTAAGTAGVTGGAGIGGVLAS